jgi:hypothetical protein
MWGFVCWFGILAVAGLCYPRRPRTSGTVFILLGVWSLILQLTARTPVSVLHAFWFAALWFGLGVSYLIRFRDPLVRAKHVAHWTTKS